MVNVDEKDKKETDKVRKVSCPLSDFFAKGRCYWPLYFVAELLDFIIIKFIVPLDFIENFFPKI